MKQLRPDVMSLQCVLRKGDQYILNGINVDYNGPDADVYCLCRTNKNLQAQKGLQLSSLKKGLRVLERHKIG